ncbi:MAG TPA: amidohydrolase family protein [Acidimicrobiales bacterium]|nr:amidohydrolase family protein [Acidimicrobiales bacterium]
MRLSGARILTCEDSAVIDDGAIGVEAPRIAWVGPAAALPEAYLDPSDEVLDLAGCTVMPGLVDGHLHISFGEATSEEELAMYASGELRAVRAAIDAAKPLAAGVTSACDPGGYYPVALAVREAIDSGLVPGPRFSVAGHQLTTHQGIGAGFPTWLGEPPFAIGKIVDSRDAMLAEIRREVKDGVDLIKLAGSGGDSDEFAAFRPEELELAASEAHRLGRPIAVHARSRQAVIDSARAGVDWIMHASFMDKEGLDLVLERGIPLLPALTLLVNSLEANRGSGVLSPSGREHLQRELDAACEALRAAYEAGAILIAGSESGFAMTPYGEWHAREMSLFVELLGMRPVDAIISMTRHAARAVPRWRDQIGVLSAGKLADLLVVDGKPDEDVRLLGRRSAIRRVMQGGVFVEGAPGTAADLRGVSAPTAERRRGRAERTHLYTGGTIYRNPEMSW